MVVADSGRGVWKEQNVRIGGNQVPMATGWRTGANGRLPVHGCQSGGRTDLHGMDNEWQQATSGESLRRGCRFGRRFQSTGRA